MGDPCQHFLPAPVILFPSFSGVAQLLTGQFEGTEGVPDFVSAVSLHRGIQVPSAYLGSHLTQLAQRLQQLDAHKPAEGQAH